MGYVHDTSMSQFISPAAMFCVSGTWTEIAGQVAGTIVKHKAAAADTSVVTIPIIIPSNSVALKGSYLKSIEIDYEILIADVTSITPTVNKVTRGIDGAVAVVAAQAHTQLPVAATAIVVDQHKLVLTITTPFWIANNVYVLVALSIVAALTSQVDILGAVANFTKRL